MIRGILLLEGGRKALFLGVDDENIRRLTSGKPILVKGESVGLTVDVIILHRPTVADLWAELQAAKVAFGPVPREETLVTDPSGLPMWTIYDHPADIPVGFVVRRWDTRAGCAEPFKGEILGVFESLEEARRALPRGLVCLARDPGDDPHVVETWL